MNASYMTYAVYGSPLDFELEANSLLYRQDIFGDENPAYYGGQHIATEKELEWLGMTTLLGPYNFDQEFDDLDVQVLSEPGTVVTKR